MDGFEVVYDHRHVEGGLIERVELGSATDLDTYPSGVRYAMHIGTLDGLTLLRYDNAHEATKGHEKHTAVDDTTIEFPGLEPLLVRFFSEADVYWAEADLDGPNRPDERTELE